MSRQPQARGSRKQAHIVDEDALVALAHEGCQLAHCLVVVPPQRLAPLVVLLLDQPPHLQHDVQTLSSEASKSADPDLSAPVLQAPDQDPQQGVTAMHAATNL